MIAFDGFNDGNEVLQELELRGMVLDVGGGATADWVEGTLHSLGNDPSWQPTHLGDANETFPFDDAAYDSVLSFNTLEHIWNEESALHEIHRVLKPGGWAYIGVPFLFRVHGYPSDYHRHTCHWWDQKLEQVGFAREAIRIEPLVWDMLGTGFALTEFWAARTRARGLRFIRRAVLLAFGVAYQQLRWGSKPIDSDYIQHESDHALGYFISAQKP